MRSKFRSLGSTEVDEVSKSIVSYRIGVEDAGLKPLYVHLFITYFNTITDKF